MIRATIYNSSALILLLTLSACAGPTATKQQASTIDECPPPNTLTCDRFAGENYNCSCESSDRLEMILDSY